MKSGVKFALVMIGLLTSLLGIAQSDSVLRLRQIDSIFESGNNPNSMLKKNDTTTNNSKKDTTVFSFKNDSSSNSSKPDSLPKKRKGKLAIALGGAFNLNRNILRYSYQASENKADNVFLDFKITPQINFMYISKNYFIAAIEAWEQSGNNVMDNLVGGNSLIVTHFSFSLMHLIKAKTTDKYTVAPYIGMKYSYSTKDLSYLIKYNTLDSSTVPPHLDSIQYLYSYSESSVLDLIQLPFGITFMSNKIIADLGASLNIYGTAKADWQTKNNQIQTYYQSGNYAKSFLGGRKLLGKNVPSLIKKTGDMILLGNISFKVGYLFQNKARKPHAIQDEGPASK